MNYGLLDSGAAIEVDEYLGWKFLPTSSKLIENHPHGLILGVCHYSINAMKSDRSDFVIDGLEALELQSIHIACL